MMSVSSSKNSAFLEDLTRCGSYFGEFVRHSYRIGGRFAYALSSPNPTCGIKTGYVGVVLYLLISVFANDCYLDFWQE